MLAKFNQLVQASQLPKTSQIWFPKQLRHFCSFTSQNPEAPLDCSQPTVESFLRHLKKSGKAAWQRLQALEAIQLYAKQLLPTVDPELDTMRVKLAELKVRENRDRRATTLPDPNADIDPNLLFAQAGEIGEINPDEPELDRELRKLMRVRHYALRTERAYLGWLQRFRTFLDRSDLQDATEVEIRDFLSHLAIEGQVAASTQNQAFSALLFLYRDVLGRQVKFLEAERAKTPERVPVVLTPVEVQTLFQHLGGGELLFARLFRNPFTAERC